MDARFPLAANLPEERHGMIIMVCAGTVTPTAPISDYPSWW